MKQRNCVAALLCIVGLTGAAWAAPEGPAPTSTSASTTATPTLLSAAHAAEVVPGFRPALERAVALAVADVEVIRLEDGACHLVGVGRHGRLEGVVGAAAALKLRTLGRLEAQKQLAVFLNGTITTEQSVATEKTTIVETLPTGEVERRAVLAKVRSSLTVEQAQLAIKGARVIATWWDASDSLFTVAVAHQIPCP